MTVELGGFFDTDEGEAGATEEFLHVFRVTTDVVFGFCAVVEFDCADGADGAFIAKNEVNSLILNKTVSFVAVLVADLVTQEGGKADVGDDIKTSAENIVEELETVFLTADHELFARAIMKAVNSGAALFTRGDDNKNR